jgi:low affinity Fe/Cu permease
VSVRGWFHRFAQTASAYAGHPLTFAIAFGSIVVWAAAGPLFGYSDTWQLIINTSTTIITCLLAFLIQHSQNADTIAIQKKLDEIVRAIPQADDRVAGCEHKEGR